jgi:hypothetical protein
VAAKVGYKCLFLLVLISCCSGNCACITDVLKVLHTSACAEELCIFSVPFCGKLL